VVTRSQIVRSDCVVALTIPPNASGVPSAFRPRFLPLLHSYFFRGGGFELEWGGKKAGRATLYYTALLPRMATI